MRLLDVTDDTVNVQKSLLEELRTTACVVKYSAAGEELSRSALPPLMTVALHPCGHRVLLRLLLPPTATEEVHYLEPEDEALFLPHVANQSSSKKTAELRRREHLAFLRAPLLTLCGRHCEQLARSRCGSKVLQAALLLWHPPALIRCLARLVAGLPAEVGEEDDEEERAAVEEDGDYEDSQQGDYDHPEEEDEEGEALQEGDSEAQALLAELAEAEDELDAAGDRKEEEKKPEVALLPIEEDPVAHALLKKLLAVELALETGKGTGVDQALWESPHWQPPSISKKGKRKGSAKEEEEGGSVSRQLLRCLEERDCLPQWLRRNRPCFALAELFKVPSVSRSLFTLLDPHRKLLADQASQHVGGKLLNGLLIASVE